MIYTVQAGTQTGTFSTADEAIAFGQANASDTFVVVFDGTTAYAIGMLITYKQQNGRKGRMWNISYC